MRKCLIVVLLLLLLHIFASNLTVYAGDPITVRVGVYENSPKIFIDEKGNASGFWSDIIEYIAAEEGWEIKYIHGTWMQCLSMLEKNEIDLMPDVAYTEERSSLYAFSNEPVYVSWSKVYARTGSDIQSILDLEGRNIAVLKGSVNFEGPEGIKKLVSSFSVNCTFTEVDSYTRVFEMVESGEADAGVTSKDFGRLHEEDYYVDGAALLFQHASLYFALPKDSSFTPYLIERVDYNVKELKKDEGSVYYQSLEKWLGVIPVGKSVIPEWIRWALIGSGGLALLLAGGAYILKAQVKARTKELTTEINDRKQAEEALIVSEARFKELAEMLPEVIFEADKDNNLTYANQEAFNLFGYLPEDIQAVINVLDMIVPAERTNAMERLIRRKKGENIGSFEYTALRKDGSTFPILLNISIVQKEEITTGFRGVIVDITKLKQTERERERYLDELTFINETITQTSRIGNIDEICRYVGEKVQSVNEKSLVVVTLYDKSIGAIRIRSISGISGFADRMNELVGIDPFELHFEQDKTISNTRPYTGGKLARIPGGIYEISDGQIPEEICDKLENIFDLHDVYTVGFSLGELPLGGIVLFLPENQEVNLAYAIEAVASDVSLLIHRLNAEEELKQKLRFDETISSSFTRFVGTSSVDEAINALLADSGTMCGADRAYLFLFSRDGDKLSNSHEWCAEGIRPQMDTLQDLPCTMFPWWIDKLQKGETIYIRDVTTMPEEAQAEKKLLEAQDIKAVLILPLYIGNTLSGFIGFDNVITTAGWTENNISVLQTCSYIIGNAIEGQLAAEEKKQLEQQFHQVQRLESVGRLAGGVAHDLNNMLTPILGYSELLLEKANSDDKTRESLEEISNAGKRARDMVRQLLAFSRRQTLEFTNIDLNIVLKDFQKLLRSTIREDIDIKFIPAGSLPIIKGDIGQLEQVIMNLMINAQDAMPEGGNLTIETSLAELDESYAAEHAGVVPGRYVRLTISDTGHGMEENTLEQIFEPFFTTKSKEKGTGLGLSIVYGIIKQHGGNIWVYSEPDHGTTFKVYLPVPGELLTEITLEDQTPVDLQASETILLVEDNENVRRLAHTILEQRGYTVIVAQNGVDALLQLKSHRGSVDLLLTDVIMPDMNGKELFTKVSKEYPGLKVLYMSGYTDDVITQHGVLEEGAAFIQKPFTVQSLSTKIRKVLS